MKKIIYILLITLFSVYISSCKNMDDIYKEFIVPNGLKYPQKPESLKIFAGYNKIRITWLRAKDPSITHAKVYWNNYLDSLKVDLTEQKDTIMVDIDNLGENTYTFYVKTFDKQGNASIPSEVSGAAYGDNYLLGTTARTISSAFRDENRNGTITWDNKTTDLVYSEVRYTTFSGETKTIRVVPEVSSLICPKIKPGEFFEYRSVFLPPNGIDSVAREWVNFEKPFIYKYPRNDWTAVAKNGNHDWDEGGGGQTSLLFDGNLATGWHSKEGTPFPNCVVVDMKESLIVDYIMIYPPNPANWRYLKTVQVYLTDSSINPDDPDLSSIVSTITASVSGEYPGGDCFSMYLPSPLTGRYLTLFFPNSTSSFISFMELEVYGY